MLESRSVQAEQSEHAPTPAQRLPAAPVPAPAAPIAPAERVPLMEVLRQIRVNAARDPAEYLEDTLVPRGGE